MVVSLHCRLCEVVFLPQFEQLLRQLPRRIVPQQLRTLGPQLPVNHLRARVVAVRPASRRIDSHHILPPRLWRQPDQQSMIIPPLDRFTRRLYRPFHRFLIEHTLARRPEARHRIFRKLLCRERSQRFPLHPPPSDLPWGQTVLSNQLLLFRRECRKRLPPIFLVTRLEPPGEKVSRIPSLRRSLPLFVKQSTGPIRRRLQHNLAPWHHRRPQRSQSFISTSTPARH